MVMRKVIQEKKVWKKGDLPLISVIIPTLNEEEFLARTISAIKDQTIPRHMYEIIVSDSSSKDRTVEIAKRIADRVVICERMSAGHGRNCGAKVARGKYFAFPDADTIVSRTWLEGLIHGLEKKGAVACTGPVHGLERKHIGRRIFYILWSIVVRVSFLLGAGLIPGHNFGVTREAFFKAGKFIDGNITSEDYEFSRRLKKFGRLVYSNKMFVRTSERRFDNVSMFAYVMNGIKFMFNGKSTMTWEDWRPEEFGKNKTR